MELPLLLVVDRLEEASPAVGAAAASLAGGKIDLHLPVKNQHSHTHELWNNMLGRVVDTAQTAGIEARITTQQTDLNGDWAHIFSNGIVSEGIDLVWSSLVLHHLDDPARALLQSFTVLRPGGVLVLTELLDGGIDWPGLIEQTGFELTTHFGYDLSKSETDETDEVASPVRNVWVAVRPYKD